MDTMKENISRIFLLLCLFVLAIGCARAGTDYALSTGDLVRVTVYDHADLTTETRVTENGSILFPLVGDVPVGGSTANEASARIAKLLEGGGFLKSPQVNVVVLEFKGREVSVLGKVNRPGKYPLQKASKLTDILALAGGVQPDAADTLVLLTHRDGKAQRQEIDLQALFQEGGDSLNVDVVNNDILYVPREPRFYIYGEVQRPGTFRLEKNMSVVQALSVGGGITLRGTQKGIRVMRRDADGTMKTLEVKLSDMLRPDDVVYVKESLF
jgi:polysaccharide export outer membrane protein